MKTFLTVCVSLLGLASAVPLNSTSVDGPHELQRREAKAGDFYLRILPLGGSIVWGSGSSDGNGFRKPLRDQLRYAGWKVNMVGSKTNGFMVDNNLEAHPGDTIDQINTAAQLSYKYLPNVVIINAGTNDVLEKFDTSKAQTSITSMGNLIDGLYKAIPGTTIIISTLLPSGDVATQANALKFNADLRQMVESRINSGQKIILAELANGFLTLLDLQDGNYPTDAGYRKVASAFWYAIQGALDMNFITAPADSGIPDAGNNVFSIFNPNGDDGPVSDPSLPVYEIESYANTIGVNVVTCTIGTGPSNPADEKTLCAFTCAYGVCPSPCTCIATGFGNTAPVSDGTFATSVAGAASGVDTLCGFSCARQHCPTDLCVIEDYTKVQCTNTVVTDASTNPIDRWNQTYAELAWADAVGNWKANPSPGGLTFPEQVSNFFHGPEGMNCGTTDDHNGCNSYSECSDTNHPAGYLILNSMVTLDNLIMNWYDAIVRVEANLLAKVGDMASDFAPVPQEPDAVKMLLDMIQIGYGLSAAGVWNSALKGVAYFKANSNTLGVLKDSVNSLVSSGSTLVKDLQSSSNYELAEENTLTSNIGKIINLWYASVDALNTNIFNGSDNNIDSIHNLIQNGHLLENSFNPISDTNIQLQMERAIFAALIPGTWALSENQMYPVVLDVGTACGDNVDFSALIINNDITAGAINDWTCVNGKIYYLLAAEGLASDCGGGDGAAVTCTDNDFVGLPGLGLLDGTSSVYGGLTKVDFINGAINTYVKNGNQNGAARITGELDTSTVNTLQDLDVRAPGIVTLPVCSYAEARRNWGNKKTNDNNLPSSNYPCN